MDFLTPSLPYIAALQRYQELKPLMLFLTALGSVEFFLLALPLTYWCINRSVGWRLGLLVIGNAILNDILKLAFALPRPYWVSPDLKSVAVEHSFGLPSGHAQGAAAFWAFLAFQFRDRTKRAVALGAAAGITTLIAISRFFLGVHFPADAIAGAIFGYMFFALFLGLEPAVTKWFKRFSFDKRLLLIAATVVGLFLLTWIALQIGMRSTTTQNYAEYAATARGDSAMAERIGSMCGLLLGLILEARLAPFSTSGPVGQKILRFIVGIIGVLIFWKGLGAIFKALFPDETSVPRLAADFIRYALMAWWIVSGAPALFVKLKLMSREFEESVDSRKIRYGAV